MARATPEQIEEIRKSQEAYQPHPVWIRILLEEIDALRVERDDARSIARQCWASVKAYSEELNGEKTEHLFDEAVASWAK